MPERSGTSQEADGQIGLPPAGPSADEAHVARRAAQLSDLLQRISTLANEATDTPTALAQAVSEVCSTMGWPAGQAMRVTDDGVPAPIGDPHVPGDPQGRADLEAAAGATDDRSPALEVARSGQARWVRDVTSPDGDTAMGWVAFPVTVDGDVTAVLQFVSVERRDPAPDFLRTMANIGRQLGLLIERNRARDQLEELNTELQRSNQQLERFAYVASHDLQEPLRKIVGFTELLEQRYGDRLDGEAEEFLGIVVDGAYRMRQLINDLLAYSRAGRRQPEMDRVELTGVVDNALGDLQPAIEDAGAVRVEHPLPAVNGNTSELHELFINLIGNALKYRGDEPADVIVSARRAEDGWWQLTIADHGIGIDPQHHDRIFEVFQRLHGPGRYEGTGIGLAVCQQIADHHGGRIWVESDTGEGCRVHVTLPSAAEADAQSVEGRT